MTPLLAQVSSPLWPFAVLAISVLLIIVLITGFRLHAFFALILAALAAGMLAEKLPGEPEKSHWLLAVEMTTTEFGVTAGKIGVVIGLAAIIGMCLMESGAADKVVRRFLALFGEKRAAFAILTSGYILSIPIFFDTFFMLLLPLAVAMHLRTGKDYLLYIMAICCGGTVTHSLIAPHPGPLAMAESLRLDLGLTIMVGIVVGIIPTLASYFAIRWVNSRMQIPLRETQSISIQGLRANLDRPESELPGFWPSITPVVLPIILISLASTFIAIQGKAFDHKHLTRPQDLVKTLRTPPAGNAFASWAATQLSPVSRAALTAIGDGQPTKVQLDPILADFNRWIRGAPIYKPELFQGIALRPSTLAQAQDKPQGQNLVRVNRALIEDGFAGLVEPTTGMNPLICSIGLFWGDRNVALMVGALLAMLVLKQQRGISWSKIGDMVGPPFETAGVIILITSAGGAFGLMLKNAGVGDAVKALVEGRDVNLLLLSWVVAAVIRVAQGSATVAMLTTAAMIYPIMSGSPLPYHPVYLFMSIGFGAMFLSWMNDSGFWVVGRLSGFTEKETLKTWTVVVTVNSVAGLLACLLFSSVLPMPIR